MVEWDSLTEPLGRALGVQGRARETEDEVREVRDQFTGPEGQGRAERSEVEPVGTRMIAEPEG